MKLKLEVEVRVDKDEFLTPTDGDVVGEIKAQLESALYDIDGITVINIKRQVDRR